MKKLSFWLQTLGIVSILRAITMDTTVSTGLGQVYNIGLLAERQSLLLIGFILSVAGTVLRSIQKQQKNSEQKSVYSEGPSPDPSPVDPADHAEEQARQAAAAAKVKRVVDAFTFGPSKALSDYGPLRLKAGVFVALCAAPVSDSILVWWALPLVAIYCSLTIGPAHTVLRLLLGTNVILTLMDAWIFMGTMVPQDSLMYTDIASKTPLGIAIYYIPSTCAIFGAAISLIGLVKLRRKFPVTKLETSETKSD